MPSILTSGFDSDGVTLIAASAQDFDARAQSILAGRAGPVLDLKPYLTIVSNRNPRTVVAYTVSWTTTLGNEASEVSYTQLKFPDAVAGAVNGVSALGGREIENGEERLVGMGFEAWPSEYAYSFREFGMHTAFHLGDVRRLDIGLDAVIFEDGTMLGPDASRLAEHFIAFVYAKQTLYREVVAGLEDSDGTEDIFAPVRKLLKAPQSAAPTDPLAVYRRQAAAEVLQLQNRAVLEVFRRALRRDPFAIRRSQGQGGIY